MAEVKNTIKYDIKLNYKDGEKVRQAKEDISKVADAAGKSSTKFKELFSSLKRIALYRAVRTALKAITASLKEGLTNLYKWSRISGGSFAKQMDNLTTSFQYLKNSITVAFAPLLEYIILPLLSKLTDYVAEVINKFAYWVSGIRAVKKEAKYLKTELGSLGIDEINKVGEGLNEHSTSYAEMFQGTSIGDLVSRLKEKIASNEVASKIFTWFGKLFELVDWNGLGAKIGEYIANVLKSDAFWQVIANAIKSAFELAFGALKGIFKGIFGSYIDEEMQRIDGKDFAKGGIAVAKAMVTAVKEGFLSAYKGLESLWADLFSAFGMSEKASNNTSKALGGLGKLFTKGIIGSNPLGIIYNILDQVGLFANGGFPSQGSLFLANEGGAEMVGNIGGRTAVANNDQIVEAIKQGVYEAMMGANGGNQTLNANLYLDGKQIGKQVINYHNGIVKQTGASPLLV